MDLRDAYDLDREISSGRGTAVYAARRKGTARSRLYAVKVLRLLDPSGGSVSNAPRVVSFLKAAELQKKAQELGARHIAPVFRIETDSAGAWYASRYYPSSLSRVIEGRIRLDLEDFHHLFHSILRGLCDLKKRTDQSHGNLKPSNVLFEGSGKLRRRRIFLADLKPSPEDPGAGELSDLRALGEILWHVARATKDSPRYPVSESDPDWAAYFGAAAAEWIGIYNQLRGPKLSPADLDLAKLRSMLPGMPLSVRATRTGRRTAPLTVPLVAVLGFGSYLRYGPVPERSPMLQNLARHAGNRGVQWHDLRKDYDDWFGPLSVILRNAGSRHILWTTDSYLDSQVIQPIDRARPDLENLDIENQEVRPANENARINRISTLISSTRTALERWPMPPALGQAASQFQQRDWKRPADELRTAAGGVQLQPGVKWEENLNRLFAIANEFQACETHWSKIEDFAGNQNPKLAPTQLLDVADRGLNPALTAAGDLRALADELDLAVDAVRKYLSTGLSPSTIAEFATAQIGYSTAINREWLRLRNAIAPNLTLEPGNQELFARLKNIYEGSAYLASTNFLPSPGLTGSAYYRELKDKVESTREAFLARLVQQHPAYWRTGFPADFKSTPEVVAMRNEYLKWRQNFDTLMADLDQLPRSLTTGAGDEALRLCASCRSIPDFRDLEQDPGLQPILTQVNLLEEVRTNTSPAELVDYATNARPDLTFAVAVKSWERLHDPQLGPWPANLVQTKQEAQAQASLSASLERIRALDADQYETLRRQLAQGRQTLFQAVFRTLADADITEALQFLRETLGQGSLSDLDSPSMRFNLLLHDFRTSHDFAKMTVSQLVETRNQFVAGVDALGPGITGRPELGRLADIRKLAFDQSGPSDASAAQLPFWTRQDRPEARVYSWTARNNRNYELEFVLLSPKNSPPYYLCTTELPVGLVVDWLTEHKTNLVDYIPWVKQRPTDDRRQGIRTWEAEVDTPERRPIRISDAWQGSSWTTYWEGNESKEFQPGVAKPDAMHPANYLPPKAAKFLAEALGFRLPTPAEWLAAYRASGSPGGNLRDLSWEKQREYIQGLHPRFDEDKPWPNRDIFRLTTTPIETDAAWRTNYEDGVLWFAEVNQRVNQRADARFIHLVGNVAEYVYDPIGAGAFYVLGGSALSSPDLQVDHPYPVDPRMASRGYSDVGVRLALDAPMSPSEKFRWLVMQLAYVVGE
jgi:hypothetical protein